jgi:hypothetical protein
MEVVQRRGAGSPRARYWELSRAWSWERRPARNYGGAGALRTEDQVDAEGAQGHGARGIQAAAMGRSQPATLGVWTAALGGRGTRAASRGTAALPARTSR